MPEQAMRSPEVVDIHCHFVPRGLPGAFEAFALRPDDVWPEMLFHDDEALGPVIPRLTEVSLLLEDMDRCGIDVRAVCTASWLFCYWADEDLGRRFARATNDRVAEVVAAHPSRLVGLATIPLQDLDAALEELERAVRDLGMRGVAVGTNVNGRYFDDPSLFPFLEAVHDLDVPLFFHPDRVAGEDRLSPYKLIQMLGNPHETTIALARIVLGGVLDRLPGLKLSFAQAGGSVAILLGRMDHAWRVRPEAHANTARPPSEYLGECYFDTITHSPEPLGLLLRHVPADRLLLGSDYPWDMGEPDPVGRVRSLALDDPSTSRILGANAAALLKL